METQTGMTLQEAARTTRTAKSSMLQFRWLDAPRSIGTARSAQAPGCESPLAASTKADALEHGDVGGNEVLQQVLQRAIVAEQKASLLEASLKDMTTQRDKWMLQADDWKEQAQHAQRQLACPVTPAPPAPAPAKPKPWWRWLRSAGCLAGMGLLLALATLSVGA
jgi:hypothetical protein